MLLVGYFCTIVPVGFNRKILIESSSWRKRVAEVLGLLGLLALFGVLLFESLILNSLVLAATQNISLSSRFPAGPGQGFAYPLPEFSAAGQAFHWWKMTEQIPLNFTLFVLGILILVLVGLRLCRNPMFVRTRTALMVDVLLGISMVATVLMIWRASIVSWPLITPFVTELYSFSFLELSSYQLIHLVSVILLALPVAWSASFRVTEQVPDQTLESEYSANQFLLSLILMVNGLMLFLLCLANILYASGVKNLPSTIAWFGFDASSFVVFLILYSALGLLVTRQIDFSRIISLLRQKLSAESVVQEPALEAVRLKLAKVDWRLLVVNYTLIIIASCLILLSTWAFPLILLLSQS